jgi:alpha-aminoadipic semialdehyde synthase
MVEPVSPDDRFELQDYYQHPEKYRSRFSTYVPYLTVLVNGIYWESKYPRLVTKRYLRELFGGPTRPRLRVIGDISCDVEGAIECTVRCTEPGDPVYVYNPLTGETADGYAGEGVVVLAVDILPSQLPREASMDFSAVLKRFIPAIAQADYTVPFEELALPPEIKRAVIAYRGELTPDYRYLEQYLRV